MLKRIIDTFISKQFFLFVLIGGINTFNGSILSFLFSLILQANIAFIIGYIIALTIAFFLNSYFVFKVNPKFPLFVKFGLSYIPNFIIQNFVVFIVYNILGFHPLVSYVLAAVVGLPVTFLLVKLFAFRT